MAVNNVMRFVRTNTVSGGKRVYVAANNPTIQAIKIKGKLQVYGGGETIDRDRAEKIFTALGREDMAKAVSANTSVLDLFKLLKDGYGFMRENTRTKDDVMQAAEENLISRHIISEEWAKILPDMFDSKSEWQCNHNINKLFLVIAKHPQTPNQVLLEITLKLGWFSEFEKTAQIAIKNLLRRDNVTVEMYRKALKVNHCKSERTSSFFEHLVYRELFNCPKIPTDLLVEAAVERFWSQWGHNSFIMANILKARGLESHHVEALAKSKSEYLTRLIAESDLAKTSTLIKLAGDSDKKVSSKAIHNLIRRKVSSDEMAVAIESVIASHKIEVQYIAAKTKLTKIETLIQFSERKPSGWGSEYEMRQEAIKVSRINRYAIYTLRSIVNTVDVKPQEVDLLAKSTNEKIRLIAAQSMEVPIDSLVELAKDKDEKVQKAAVQTLLKRIEEDKDIVQDSDHLLEMPFIKGLIES